MKRNTHWQLEDDSDPDRNLKFGPMKRMKRGGVDRQELCALWGHGYAPIKLGLG